LGSGSVLGFCFRRFGAGAGSSGFSSLSLPMSLNLRGGMTTSTLRRGLGGPMGTMGRGAGGATVGAGGGLRLCKRLVRVGTDAPGAGWATFEVSAGSGILGRLAARGRGGAGTGGSGCAWSKTSIASNCRSMKSSALRVSGVFQARRNSYRYRWRGNAALSSALPYW